MVSFNSHGALGGKNPQLGTGYGQVWVIYIFIFLHDRFLRATAYAVSAHMLSQFRPSVRLSVTRVDQSKTVEVRIMQFSKYSSPIPLVFAH